GEGGRDQSLPAEGFRKFPSMMQTRTPGIAARHAAMFATDIDLPSSPRAEVTRNVFCLAEPASRFARKLVRNDRYCSERKPRGSWNVTTRGSTDVSRITQSSGRRSPSFFSRLFRKGIHMSELRSSPAGQTPRPVASYPIIKTPVPLSRLEYTR